MTWRVVLTSAAERQLHKLPPEAIERVSHAIDGMYADPLGGDVVKLKGLDNHWRHRLGSYRILFQIDGEHRVAFVYGITRRTSATY